MLKDVATKSWLPSGENARLSPLTSETDRSLCMERTSMKTTSKLDATASLLPSGENARKLGVSTKLTCPSNRRLVTSQNLIKRSYPLETRVLPSGENAREVTIP